MGFLLMASSDLSTEQRILDAAHMVFLRKGTSGASLKDIAREADVNQALLHYYFDDKKTLADTVFEQVSSEFIPKIQEVFVAEQPIEEKVEVIVQKYVELIRENPYLPSYIIGELNQNPEEMKERFQSMGLAPFDELDRLDEQLQEKAEAGKLRPISVEQFVVNLLSLCIFPFIARPLFEAMFDMDGDAFERFVDERKREIPTFFLNALQP
jgi:AcrR family transcriptional regulator